MAGGSPDGTGAGPPDDQGDITRLTDGGEADPEAYTLEFIEEGQTVECAPDKYVLDAALDAGIGLPYGCLMGVCTICSARVEGEIDQSEGAALTPEETEKGYALTCVAYPRSDLRIHTDEGP